MTKKISIITPCYNEEKNVELLYEAVKSIFLSLEMVYSYEHIFIDNASKDKTVSILKELALKDKNLKIIVNNRNFGHIRSPYHALLQCTGDAGILLAADFQDPPAMIKDFLIKWEEEFKTVIAIKTASEESKVMYFIRGLYYKLVCKLSDVDLNNNFTGFGLYDRVVIENLRKLGDPYPYFRGLISELGYSTFKIPFKQPIRKRGISANNFYSLYDIAMLGITNHSKVPLRIATIAGFLMAAISLFIAMAYLILKLVFWNYFGIGIAPILISLFFFSSVQLFFIGVLGEYIGSIHTYVQDRPLVIEKERVNF